MELSAETMAKHLPMRRAIRLMEDAFREISGGTAVCPVRLNLPVEDQDANSLIMPCYLPGSGLFGIKTANVFPNNRGSQVPVINSIYHLYSAKTGVLEATMDGTFLTKLRTGAASGLASDVLAAPDASVLAIFGAGAQAESQIEAVCCIRDIREILVFGTDQVKFQCFSKDLSSRYNAEVHAPQLRTELGRADIICTATRATRPLFQAEDVKPGAHLNAIGAYRPDMCEIPPELIASCRLIVDQTEAALEEAGDIIQPLRAGLIQKRQIHAELGELLDRRNIVRRQPEEITVFKSVGSAVQDFVCARDLFEQVASRT